jgi:cellobiose transport system substrate-binding protein
MRKYAPIAALAAMSLVLAACGGGDNTTATGDADESTGAAETTDDGEAAPSGDQITLNLWTFGNFGYDELIEEYEADNPNVMIETLIQEFDPHHDALITSLAAGTGGPDIAAAEVAFIGAFANQPDAFLNVQEYAAPDLRESYLDWKWDQATSLDGAATVGLPTDVGGLAICYRMDLFEEAGLPTDRDEVSALWADSWEDYIAVGQQYTEATGRAFIDNEGLLWDAVVNQSPDTYYNDQGEYIYEESEQVQYAWDVVTSAIDAGIDAKIPAWSAEWNAGMNNGDFAVLTCPAWMRGYIEDQAPDTFGNWDVATVPEGGGNWGGSHLVIPAQTEHPQEAYDFMAWILAPEQQLRVFEGTGNFPSTPELYDSEPIQAFTSEFLNNAPLGEIYSENALDVVAQNVGENYNLINQEFGQALNRVAEGLETPDEAWESAIANINRELGL